jgi:hypothetical protein
MDEDDLLSLNGHRSYNLHKRIDELQKALNAQDGQIQHQRELIDNIRKYQIEHMKAKSAELNSNSEKIKIPKEVKEVFKDENENFHLLFCVVEEINSRLSALSETVSILNGIFSNII